MEEEISRLEKDAIKSGLLHPSATYSQTRSWAAVPLFLGSPAVHTSGKRSGANSVIKVPRELPDSEKASVTLMKPIIPRFQLPPALAPATYIRRWLNDLRVSPRDRVRQFWTQTFSRNQEKVAETDDGHRPSSMSDRSVPEQLDKNWVYVVKALSEPELDMRSHPQTTPPRSSRPPHPDSPAVEGESGPIEPQQRPSGPDVGSLPPLSNPTRMPVQKPCGDAKISCSV